ncbi:MAG: hypothetical protein AAFV53_19105 [Myxococcota bacterium]
MPLHILDWAKINPPVLSSPYPLNRRRRQQLCLMLRHALDPPLVQYSEVEEDEWVRWTPHGFVAREAIHPDIGWTLKRLISPLRFEVHHDSTWGHCPDEAEWQEAQDDEWWVQQNGDQITITDNIATVEINPDGVSLLIHADELDGLDLRCSRLVLAHALQCMTGLAFYCPKGLRCFEPVQCAVCHHNFVTIVMTNDDFEGCPQCGVEWVWIQET